MHSRFHSLVDAAAAAAAESSPPEGPILPLFSIDELEPSYSDVNALIQFFLDRKIELDPDRDSLSQRDCRERRPSQFRRCGR